MRGYSCLQAARAGASFPSLLHYFFMANQPMWHFFLGFGEILLMACVALGTMRYFNLTSPWTTDHVDQQLLRLKEHMGLTDKRLDRLETEYDSRFASLQKDYASLQAEYANELLFPCLHYLAASKKREPS